MRSSARLLLACGLLLALRFQPEAAARPLDQVVADGTLRVAVYGDNAPFSDAGTGKPGVSMPISRKPSPTG